MKPLLLLVINLSFLHPLVFSQPDDNMPFTQINPEQTTPINTKILFDEDLDKIPPDIMNTGHLMIGIDGQTTGDQIFASVDKNGNLSGNLSILLQGTNEKIQLTPKSREDINILIDSTIFYDKSNNTIALTPDTTLNMWTNDKQDLIVTKSMRYGKRYTLFNRVKDTSDSSSKYIGRCIARCNISHSKSN